MGTAWSGKQHRRSHFRQSCIACIADPEFLQSLHLGPSRGSPLQLCQLNGHLSNRAQRFRPNGRVGILTSHPEAVESVWPMSRHCLDAYVLFEAKMQAKWAKSPGRFNARGMLCVVGAVMGKK